ncbi:hypothetical protein C8R48DRAFT_781371 [Suillus tomentosus]|nr:hypothetical protein C8R48DRAFT_781371 [Suillus tomentosus]
MSSFICPPLGLPPPPPGMPPPPGFLQASTSKMPPEVLAQKSQKWVSMQKKRYSEKRKGGTLSIPCHLSSYFKPAPKQKPFTTMEAWSFELTKFYAKMKGSVVSTACRKIKSLSFKPHLYLDEVMQISCNNYLDVALTIIHAFAFHSGLEGTIEVLLQEINTHEATMLPSRVDK